MPMAALTLVAAIFLAYSLPPYFTGGSRVRPTFALHYPLLVAHVMFASVALVTAVPQLLPWLRRNRASLHRRIGQVYVAAAVPAGICGWVIGAATPFGPILLASDVVMAPLWLHRRHMIRSVTLTFSIISNRIWIVVFAIALEPLRQSVFHGDDVIFGWVIAGLSGWLGWTIPLSVVQWWLVRKK
jgi:uncharacterized membrane protein